MKKLITALQERITDHNARSKAAQLAYKVRFDKRPTKAECYTTEEVAQ